MSNNFRILFKGEIVDGRNFDEVRMNVARIFKSDVGQIEKLFDGESHVIKANIAIEEAEKIQKAFQEAGAMCTVEDSMKEIDFDLNINDVDTIPSQRNKLKQEFKNIKVAENIEKSVMTGECRHCKNLIPYDAEACPNCSSDDPFSKKAISELTGSMHKQKLKCYAIITGFFLSVIICSGWGWFGWLIIFGLGINGVLIISDYYGDKRKELYTLFKHAKESAIGEEAKGRVNHLIEKSRKKLGFDIGLFDMEEEKNSKSDEKLES